MNTFFKELKIVELATVLAGPAVGTFFSELGASVIKIENKRSNGDVTRTWKIASENKTSATSAYYASVNWNKKSLFIDLLEDEGRRQVYDLIKDADVVISNYKKGDDLKLKMDDATLRKMNPSLIYAHLTGFGENNHRTAYDLVLQAETGFMHINGTAESGPIKLPIALIDMMAAHQLKEGILLAMIKKLRSGKGSHLTVSLFDSAIASLSNQASSWLMTGTNPQPIGSLHPSIAPYGEIFTTKDHKQIVLAIGSNKQFEKCCSILHVPELVLDPKYSENQGRVINRMALFAILQKAIEILDADALMLQFIKADVPAGRINSIKEVFENHNLESYILKEDESNDSISRRVKSVAFQITD